MSFPITLSESAIIRLKSIFAKDGREDVFLRVGVKGGGCSGLEYLIKLDEIRKDNDFVENIAGLEVRCDPKSATFIEGSVLDYTGNLIGGGFAMKNPNAARSCGCGTSFTPKASP